MVSKLTCFDQSLTLTHTKQLIYIIAHILKAHVLQLYSFMTRHLILMDTP